MTRLLLATLHLLALGIGLGAVWARRSALRGALDPAGLRRVFTADAWWGIAAALWIGTGLWRLLAGMEKSTTYYLQNRYFLLKMACFGLILLLELAPMITLARWRGQLARGHAIDTRRARAFGTISLIQAGVLLLMVLFATAMARGYGARVP